MNSDLGARMMKRLPMFAALTVLAGCVPQHGATYLAEDRPVPQVQPPLTLEQIERHIVSSGNKASWRIRPLQPGRLRGETRWGQYTATVIIDHDRLAYRIRFETARALGEAGSPPKVVDEAELHGVSPSEKVLDEPKVATPKGQRAATRAFDADPENGTQARLHSGGPEDFRATLSISGTHPSNTDARPTRRPSGERHLTEAELHGGSPDTKKERDIDLPLSPRNLSPEQRAVRLEYNRRVRKLEQSIDRELLNATR